MTEQIEEKLLKVLTELEKRFDVKEASEKSIGLLTTEQLAKRWEVSPNKIKQMKAENKIPFIKIGDGSIRFPIKDIEAFEARNTTRASGL